MSTSTPGPREPGPAPALEELSEAELLIEAAEAEALLRELEVHRLRVAYQWAVSHPVTDSAETCEGPVLPRVLDEPESLAGPGPRPWPPSPQRRSAWPKAALPAPPPP